MPDRNKNTMKTFIQLLSLAFIFSISSAHAAPLDTEAASEAQVAKIKMALGAQYPVIKVLSVKSTNHNNAYYVGASFNAEGVGKVVGIWLMSGARETPGLLLSVNEEAYQFSKMGKASESKAGGSVTDQEAKVLIKELSK